MVRRLSRVIITACLIAGLILFAADDAVTGTVVWFAALAVALLAAALRALLGERDEPAASDPGAPAGEAPAP